MYEPIFLSKMRKIAICKLSISKKLTVLAGASFNGQIKHPHNFLATGGLTYFFVVGGWREISNKNK